MLPSAFRPVNAAPSRPARRTGDTIRPEMTDTRPGMNEEWRDRWREGRTGWHETEGNALLRRYWPELPADSTVLVPLCGKTPDLLWLADRGHRVVGIEVSEIAVEAFFDEQGLEYDVEPNGSLLRYAARDRAVTLCCGDYFDYAGDKADALYDRGALVAVEPARRREYVTHTRRLLEPGAFGLIITLEYDQQRVAGPPYSIRSAELEALWPGLSRVYTHDDLANGPPKFREAGLEHMLESVWVTAA